MEFLLAFIFIVIMVVGLYGAVLIVQDKQRSYVIRRELENRRYYRESQD